MKKIATGYAQVLVEANFDFDPASDLTENQQGEAALKKAAKEHGITTMYFEFTDGINVYDAS